MIPADPFKNRVFDGRNGFSNLIINASKQPDAYVSYTAEMLILPSCDPAIVGMCNL
jgi:hypothetical protein